MPSNSKPHSNNSMGLSPVVKSLPQNIAIMDSEGAILAVNDAWMDFAREFGFTNRSEVVGIDYREFLRRTSEQADNVIETVTDLQDESGSVEERTHEYRSDHHPQPRFFEVTFREIDSGDQRHCSVTHQDITSCRETQDQLRASIDSFEQFSRNVDQVFWMIDLEYEDYTYISSQFEEIWGFPADEMESLPEDFLETVHPEDRPRVSEALEHQAEGNYEIEYRIIRPEGEIRWIRDRAFLVENAEENQIAGISEDITESRAVRSELELFRESLDQSADAIFLIEPSTGEFIYVNETATNKLGYDRDTLEEMSVKDIDTNLKSGDIKWRQHVEDVKNEGPVTLESKHRRQDGHSFPVEVHVDFLDIGSKPRMVAIVRDITERKKTKQENELLLKLTQIVGESEDLEIALERLVNMICQEEQWPFAEVWKPTGDNRLYCDAIYQLNDSMKYSLANRANNLQFERGEGLPGITWENQAPRRMTDLSNAEEFVRNEGARDDCLTEAVGLPVMTGDDLYAVVVLYKSQFNAIGDKQLERFHSVFQQLEPLFYRKQAEYELRKSEERLELAEQMADLGHWSISTTDQDLYWSDQLYRILGLDPSQPEPPLEEAFQLYHEEDREDIRREIERALDEQAEFQFELRIRRADGEVRHVRSIGGPRYDDEGKFVEIFGVFQDITNEKQTREKLRESEQRFRQMARTINEAFFLVDADYEKIYYINDAAADIYGVSRDRLYDDPTSWMENIVEEDLDQLKKDMQKQSDLDGPQDQEFRIRENGETRWVRTRIYPIKDDGSVTPKIVGVSSDITKRRRVQQELQEKAEFLEAVNDRLPGVTYQFKIDSDGNFSFPYMSEGHEQFCGVSSDEVMNDFDAALENIHPEDRGRLIESIEKVGKKPGPWKEEYRYIHPEEGVKWVLASSIPQQYPDGSTIWYGVIFDITERKQIEYDLRLKERALASTTEGISIADAREDDNPLIYVNEGFQNITGYEMEEVLGKNCRFLQGPETSSDAVANIREGIRRKEPVTEEIINYRKDGTTFWNELSINPIYGEEGNLTHFVGIQKDVTERKEAEQSLAVSEERFRNLVEKIENVFWVTDSDFEAFHYVSSLYEEWWGQSVEEIYNDKDAWASAVHPNDLDDLKAAIERHIVSAETPEEYRGLEQEFRIRSSDEAEWRWCYVTGSPVINDDGTVEKVVGLVSDISDQKQAQEALSKSVEEKTILVQEVHHRVKNNLQVLLGLLSLQSRRMEGEYAKRALQNSKERVHSMALIHEKLYESESFSSVNVQEYVSELIEHIIQTGKSNQLNLSQDLNIDVEKLGPEMIIPCGLIINELVSNAIEHAFSDQTSGEISVRFNRKGRKYHLEISDNGNGPSPEALFDSDSLGLTLVENLAKNQLDGTIDVQNDDGLSVYITFPDQ